jgi:hypothetical protein
VLDVIFGGLWIRKIAIFHKKIQKMFSCIFFFFNFGSSKPWILAGPDSLDMLDPDPDSLNPDPQYGTAKH